MKKVLAMMVFCTVFLLGAVSASAAANVAALMYHSVTRNTDRLDDYTVSPEQLESDIRCFMDNGYIPMTASELATEGITNINGRKVLLLTFDDGYDNFYTEVFPILKKCNAKATMFLVGSYIDRYGYLNRDQIYEMAHSGLVEMGNHTNSIHHINMNLLYNIYNDPQAVYDVIEDVRRNGAFIQSITGYEVTSISWPYGYYTSFLDSAVKRMLGYKISFDTTYGVNIFTGDTVMPLKRMNRESSATTQMVFDRANKFF